MKRVSYEVYAKHPAGPLWKQKPPPWPGVYWDEFGGPEREARINFDAKYNDIDFRLVKATRESVKSRRPTTRGGG